MSAVNEKAAVAAKANQRFQKAGPVLAYWLGFNVCTMRSYYVGSR